MQVWLRNRCWDMLVDRILNMISCDACVLFQMQVGGLSQADYKCKRYLSAQREREREREREGAREIICYNTHTAEKTHTKKWLRKAKTLFSSMRKTHRLRFIRA